MDANPDINNPGNYLHRIMVADVVSVGSSGPNIPTPTGPNNLKQVTAWYELPTGVYFDTAYSYTSSSSAGANANESIPLTITHSGLTGTVFQGSAYAYTFMPSGQLDSACQFIVAAGHSSTLPANPLYEDGTAGTPDTRQGFYVHVQGRPSFFQTSLAISSSISSH